MSIELQARAKCDRCEATWTYWIALPTVESTFERNGAISTNLEAPALPEGWAKVYSYSTDKDICPVCSAIEAEDKRIAERLARERREAARDKRKAKKGAKKDIPIGYR